MALELSAATRERDFYLKQVDHGKAIDAMSAKQQRRAEAAAAGGEGEAAPQAQQAPRADGKPPGRGRMVRTFMQVRALALRCCAAVLLHAAARVADARALLRRCARSGRCARRRWRRGCRRACLRQCLATRPWPPAARRARARSSPPRPRSDGAPARANKRRTAALADAALWTS
jgi:hypothetical protein